MFDIGFFELAVVAVVALFVVGPERLPGLVRTAGFWFGKIRYWVNSTNMEMKREWHNAEILRQEAEMKAKEAVQGVESLAAPQQAETQSHSAGLAQPEAQVAPQPQPQTPSDYAANKSGESPTNKSS